MLSGLGDTDAGPGLILKVLSSNDCQSLCHRLRRAKMVRKCHVEGHEFELQ